MNIHRRNMMRSQFKFLFLNSFLILILVFFGCEKSGLNSELNSTDRSGDYLQYATNTFYYDSDLGQYSGGNVIVPGGTTFHLDDGSLTPPPGIPFGEDVTISMLVEKDTIRNELIFTFHPSGCKFSPKARIWFHYSDLDSSLAKAKLFLIEKTSGDSTDISCQYIEMEPDDVDLIGKKILLKVAHFSRYAVGVSR